MGKLIFFRKTFYLLTTKRTKILKKSEIVILRGEKDPSVVTMNKSDYIEKLEGMIEEGVKKCTYKKTEDTTLQDLNKFQDFLYRNFYTYEHYKSMYPHSNQPAKLYGTAKTHKFNNIQEINKEKLKFGPIIDQTGTYSYNAAQVISQYLKPLSKNEFTIHNPSQQILKTYYLYKKMKKMSLLTWNHFLPVFQ